MSEERVCAVCETVNVGGAELCIACGAPFEAPTGGLTTEVDDVHGAAGSRDTDVDLDSASHQATMIEASAGRGARDVRGAAPVAVAVAAPSERPRSRPPAEPTQTGRTDPSAGARFLARVLLPDGDRRSVEIGEESVSLGSGLDDLGVTGDARVAAQEGWLSVEGDDLIVEPREGAQGLYRRLRGEETLHEGDVVLMGDIAARFVGLPAAGPVDEGLHVLGGGAGSPIGRLAFLRHDGSDGPVHDLPAGKTIIGRTEGHLNFPNDGRLSRRHARFFASVRGVTVEDLGSRNGTYLRIARRERLEVGDALRVGSAGVQIRSLA